MNVPRFEPVRLGVVGLGNFGRQHAQTIVGLAECELVSLVARRQESIDDSGVDKSTVSSWLDLDKAIRESSAEAWVVASTTASHVDITTRLLRAGKTVLLEKPISQDLQEAERLEHWVRSNPDNVMMGHIVLFNSEYRKLREEAVQRGKIIYINGVRHRPTEYLRKFPGENPMYMTMVHDLYATLALINREDPDHFSAQFHWTVEDQVDLVVVQLRWPGGTLATFTSSLLTPSGMGSNGFDFLEIYGEQWVGRMSPNPRPIEIWDNKARWPMPLEIRSEMIAPAGMMAEELRCFCRVVRGLESVPVGATYADALQVQRWMHELESVAVHVRAH